MTRTKEMTAHLRNRIKAEGIKARVRFLGRSIQVFPCAYGVEFSETEQRAIRFIAKVNKLTAIRGQEIDVDRMTDPHGMEFYA